MLCVLMFQNNTGVYAMTGLTMMLCEIGSENNIRCRAINGWFNTDSYMSSKEKLLLEIERVKPDVVVMDLGLYEKIDGTEISRRIRSQFDVLVMYI
jgi:DNA-binding NarL/FixJ family response regulator